ncbi:MAG: hypothetical protein JNK63_09170 [Chthonomonas sp.]|nr:hypothetical protein [Chthonomonas sp.]
MLAYLTKPADRLGDTIVLASIFAELMPRYPDLKVICNDGESTRWVAKFFPNLLVAPTIQDIPHPIDVLIQFGKPDLRFIQLAKRLRAKRIIAEDRGAYRWFASDLVPRGLPRNLHQANIWGIYFRCAFPELPIITRYPDLRSLVEPIGIDREYVVVHTDTGKSNRPPSFDVLTQAIEVCQLLGLGALITSSPESALAQQLSIRFPDSERLHPTGIEQLASVLSRAQLVISPDTGPAHLAAALRVPVIDLSCKVFLPSERWRPLAERVTLLRPKNGCASCLARGRCHRPPYPDNTCTETFDLDDLTEAILSAIAMQARQSAMA